MSNGRLAPACDVPGTGNTQPGGFCPRAADFAACNTARADPHSAGHAVIIPGMPGLPQAIADAVTAGMPHPVPAAADNPMTGKPVRVLAVDYGGDTAAFLPSPWCSKERQMTCKVFKIVAGSHGPLACGQGHYGG
jgi:hypothetical protein